MNRIRISLAFVLSFLAMQIFAQGNGASQLTISSAKADNAMIVLHLEGQSFCSTPLVKLNGTSLTLAGATPPSVIEAMLPAGIAAGSYLLTVSCGNGSPQNNSFDVTIGAVGPQGPQGSQGPQGLQGPKGDKGDTGATGAVGPQGPKGDKGDTGATGAQGPKGDKGDTGATGAAGSQGPKGDKGDTGATGAAGLQGPKGDKGDTGTTGSQGPQGPSGAGVPAGVVMAFAGTNPPNGYLLCDGRDVNISDYGDLYSAIGNTYTSSPNGSTFRLPDYRGYFLRGMDLGAGRDPDAPSRQLGANQVAMTQLPRNPFFTSVDGAHFHRTPTTNGQPGRREVPNNGCCGVDYADSDGPSPPTSTDGAHQHSVASGGDAETRPMNIAVYWIIKY